MCSCYRIVAKETIFLPGEGSVRRQEGRVSEDISETSASNPCLDFGEEQVWEWVVCY